MYVFNFIVLWNRFQQKSDSLGKLFEMDDNPDRKGWLDRLLAFMEEKRTPITACPTISKQPLDLFRLYFLVKDRSGYIEVRLNCFESGQSLSTSFSQLKICHHQCPRLLFVLLKRVHVCPYVIFVINNNFSRTCGL